MPAHPGEYAGDEIRETRERYGLTQTEVADAWGRPQPNLSMIETNERRVSGSMKRLILSVIRHLAKEKARDSE